MRAYVSPTDGRWAAFLRARPYLDEVNFWWPSGVTFKAIAPGERFLFKAKARDGGRLIGGGLFSGYRRMPVSDAWRFFGEANGCASEAELLAQINAYRAKNGSPPDPDPVIGCAMLYDTFFVPGDAELAPPVGYPDSATRGRGYGPEDSQWSALEAMFAELASSAPIVEFRSESDVVRYVEGARHGKPTLIVPRRGQRSFAAWSMMPMSDSARSPAGGSGRRCRRRTSSRLPGRGCTRCPMGCCCARTCTPCMTRATCRLTRTIGCG
jgi:putative restriction endonuclease